MGLQVVRSRLAEPRDSTSTTLILMENSKMMLRSFALAALLVSGALGCRSTGSSSHPVSGGKASAGGGASGSGGTAGTSGPAASGGKTGAGGSPSTGGTASSGGATGSGGTPGSGGATTGSGGKTGAGGTPAGDGYNVYSLTISAPAQTVYLNSGTSYIGHCWPIDYTVTLPMQSSASVSLSADTVDGIEITNLDANGNPIVVPGISPAPAAYDGQFIQMDVTNVVPMP